ncbi:MAG: beta-ketoacyl synthase N-terminal-like domain-containing protein [Thermoanaerobaculia bacterium]
MRVVVSGLGAVTAAGVGRTALAEALERGRVPRTEIDRSEGFHGAGFPRRAGLVPTRAFPQWIPPLEARRLSPPSRFAVVAARTALEDAGIERPEEPDPATAVSLGTAFGPSSWTQGLLDQIFGEGPQAASPVLFTESVANAPAGRVALACRAAGANHTFSQGEASALLAVARGADEIVHGGAERALAGATDEMTPLLHAILHRFGALAEGEEEPQPFGAGRDGFLAAEGAAVALLEREETAAERGARPLATLRAWITAFDPTASRAGWGRGAATLAAGLRGELERAGVALDSIDLVLSGASGSRAGDRLEAEVLAALWPSGPRPAVLAPKALTGEYGGAFLAAALLLASGAPAWLPKIPVDPALDVTPFAGSWETPPRRTLVTSLASGGAAAWLVLDRPA